MTKLCTEHDMDNSGYRGSYLRHCVGKIYLHVETNNLYKIINVVFATDLSRWGLVYIRADNTDAQPIEFFRTANYFFGTKAGHMRFLEQASECKTETATEAKDD
jgi:hypothetical protein